MHPSITFAADLVLSFNYYFFVLLNNDMNVEESLTMNVWMPTESVGMRRNSGYIVALELSTCTGSCG